MPDEMIEDDTNTCVCHGCESEIDTADAVALDNGDEYCVDCVESCDECGETFARDAEQLEDALTSGHTFWGRTSRTRRCCSECRRDCADCGRIFTDAVHGGENQHGDWVCDRCSENYERCEDCGETHRTSAMRYVDDCDEGEGWYCSTCHSQRPGRSIHDYSFKPDPVFHYGERERKTAKHRTFGVEIETENKGGDCEVTAAQSVSASGLFYCKRDGSIDEGFEMVSHPATLAHWREADLGYIDKLRQTGWRSYGTETCGMHIHVSKDSMSQLTQLKLLEFFKNNSQFIQLISRRRRSNLDRWAAIDPEYTPRKELSRKVKGSRYSERYSAINLKNTHTIEFRIFRGTLDVAAVKRNIEFVAALIRFCESHSLGQLTAVEFVRWVGKDGKHMLGKPVAETLSKWFAHLQFDPNELGNS